MRRKGFKKNEHKSDSKYGRVDVERFTNYLMTGGKKSIAENTIRKYTAVANPTDVMSLTDWIAGMPTAEQKPIDAAHAVLVEVTWTKLAGNNAGWEIWVVNPVPGGWELYEAR